MSFWQEQKEYLAASGARPRLKLAVDKLQQRVEHLRGLGHACDGLEKAIRVDWCVKASQTSISDQMTVRIQLTKTLEDTLRFGLAANIARAALLDDSVHALDLMVRVAVDGMFGYGDTMACALAGQSDRDIQVRSALSSVGHSTTALTCAVGLYYELTSRWPVQSSADVPPFLHRLMQRYSRFSQAPLSWPATDRSLEKVRLLDLQVKALHLDAAPFAELCDHQGGPFMTPAVRESPDYQALEAFWNRFLGRCWMPKSTWMVGRTLSQMLDDPAAVCTPWDIDTQALELTQRLAVQRRAKRRGVKASAASPAAAAQGPAGPRWPQDIADVVDLYNGVAPVSYGWLMFQHDDGDYANYDAFRGQRNGLVGATQPGVLVLNVGQNHGEVRLSVFHCPAEPPQPPERWQEVVEVSLVLPEGARLRVQNLCVEEEFEEALDLPAGIWRVRVVGADFASEGQDSNGKPLERYALVFWPEPAWREDAVLREHAPALMERHAQAQAGELG